MFWQTDKRENRIFLTEICSEEELLLKDGISFGSTFHILVHFGDWNGQVEVVRQTYTRQQHDERYKSSILEICKLRLLLLLLKKKKKIQLLVYSV